MQEILVNMMNIYKTKATLLCSVETQLLIASKDFECIEFNAF